VEFASDLTVLRNLLSRLNPNYKSRSRTGLQQQSEFQIIVSLDRLESKETIPRSVMAVVGWMSAVPGVISGAREALRTGSRKLGAVTPVFLDVAVPAGTANETAYCVAMTNLSHHGTYDGFVISIRSPSRGPILSAGHYT